MPIELLSTLSETIDTLLLFARENIHLAPFIICGLLLLAGLNIPISEDLMIFISAMIAINSPEYLPWIFTGLFIGAFGSDLIAYGIGRFLGERIFSIPMFKRLLTVEKLHRMANFYNKYGLRVLIVGRFIPFGVRNLMFITAGLGKSNFPKFFIADFFAALISVSTYFSLFYVFGEDILDLIKRFNIVLFSLFIVSAGIYLYRRRKKMHQKTSPEVISIEKLKELQEVTKKGNSDIR